MIHRPLLLAALVSFSFVAVPAFAQSVPAYVTAAVNDKGRPAADTMRDGNRKPAETVAFSTVKPGDKIADFIAGGGYFTRIFSKVVGPQGHVYATAPAGGMMMGGAAAGGAMMPATQGTMGAPQGTMMGAQPGARMGAPAMGAPAAPMMGNAAEDPLKAIAGDSAYSNVTVLTQPASKLMVSEPLDVVFTAQNYHDLHNPGPYHADDVAAFNKSVFDALNPGGVFLVLDYASAPGTGFSQTATLHRAEPDAEKAEILKAGFVFEGESKVLARPNDPHTMRSHEQDDQFIFRFRKPK
jgi:predicted methyltransferase